MITNLCIFILYIFIIFLCLTLSVTKNRFAYGGGDYVDEGIIFLLQFFHKQAMSVYEDNVKEGNIIEEPENYDYVKINTSEDLLISPDLVETNFQLAEELIKHYSSYVRMYRTNHENKVVNIVAESDSPPAISLRNIHRAIGDPTLDRLLEEGYEEGRINHPEVLNL